MLVIPAGGQENRPFFLQCISYISFKMPLFRIILKFERHIVVILCTKVFQVCVIFNFYYYYTTCSVLRIICFMKMREGEGAQFFLQEISIKQRKWRVFSCILCLPPFPGGFSKSFLHTMLYTVKKMCGFPVPSQDVKHSLNY